MTTAQEAFSEARTGHLRPALSAQGFKARSRSTWLKGTPDRGWVVVDIGGNRHNTRDVGDWSVAVWAWPPGTWEWATRRAGAPAEPDARVAPIYASPKEVLGSVGGERPDIVELVADMTGDQIGEAAGVLLDYARAAISWAEAVLDSDQADALTPDLDVLGAAEVTNRWTPGRLELLEQVSARAQRGAVNPAAWIDLARWRAAAGLPPVPFPEWHHLLMQLDSPADRCGSPRAAFEAGHGRALDIRRADGSTRPPRPEDFPDAWQLAEWRRAVAMIPTGPVLVLPDWLPWIDWVMRADASSSTRTSWRMPLGPGRG